ncbi:MAG: hypothetical protein PHY90_10115 [Desulfitobacteriaceae bacterium]|nr:hypothetical protein [Desulfitobacteriaceae bacterium]
MSIKTSQTLGKIKNEVILKNARPVIIIGWANTLFSENHYFLQFEQVI